ncbi:MAG TPA: MlaD family protein [Verrucomicrobiae bacterium]
MALQDLTPQLRTRLSRMERAVGWFVFLATALLLFGFGYYIYHTAERKGWFKIKAPFHTFVQTSSGLNVGDPVYMMGFPVGAITGIQAMPPGDKRNVRVDFEIRADSRRDYFRYIWRDGSYVKINTAGFLNQRQLEVTRGTNGPAIVVTQPGVWKSIPELEAIIVTETNRWQLYQDVLDDNSNKVFGAYLMLTQSNLERMAQFNLESNSIFVYDNKINYNHIVAAWDNRVHRYVNFTPDRDSAWLRAVETPPVSDQLQAMVLQVQNALPGFLSLTNQLAAVLDNAANATSNLNTTIAAARPMVSNFAAISEQLRTPGGPLVWALGTNGDSKVQGALTNLNALLVNTDTNLNQLTLQIGATLENLAGITSNLNAQVQANSNLLWGISQTVADTDDFVQGLKHHWLLRSAFKKENAAKEKTNAPVVPLLSPRAKASR